MTAQHLAYLALAAFAIASTAYAIHDWARREIDDHLEAALAPDPFIAHIDDLRSDFDPDPTDVPLLDWIAANELRPFFAEWSALAKEETL